MTAEQPKPQKPLVRILLPLILVAATVIVVSLTTDGTVTMPGEKPTMEPGVTAPPDESITGAAPEPLSPLDGIEFADTAPALVWEWPVELTDHQLFAVRVWHGDESPRETWTVDTSFDPTTDIDSYEHETGPFCWQVAVVEVDDDGVFTGMASEWSPVQCLQRVRNLSVMPVPVEERSAAARAVMARKPDSVAATIDAVRDYVSTHSDESAQGEFAPDYSDALEMMVSYDAGESEKPLLMCDGQATAALTLLYELGIGSRLIFLYTDVADSVQEHTILEVFNSESQHWELHDILTNRYFVDENGDRTTIERLVFGPLDTVGVCDSDGQCAPFYESNYRYPYHFKAFRYGYSDTFWVNPDRFDVTKRFPANQDRNLAEYLTGDPRDFVFQFDSWESGE